MNENQSLDKQKKIMISVKIFLENPTCSINEIAEIIKNTYGINISSSSVQRYLKEKTLIIQFFDSETYQRIQDLLAKNKLTGQQKGGINSFESNDFIKDEKGRFIGNRPTSESDKLEKKVGHIFSFVTIFLDHSEFTLEDVANFYNEATYNAIKVTRDYVYDCLTSNKTYDLLSQELYERVLQQLNERRIIGNRNGAEVVNKKK